MKIIISGVALTTDKTHIYRLDCSGYEQKYWHGIEMMVNDIILQCFGIRKK